MQIYGLLNKFADCQAKIALNQNKEDQVHTTYILCVGAIPMEYKRKKYKTQMILRCMIKKKLI